MSELPGQVIDTGKPLGALTDRLIANRYRIERELGSGGMATVYLAHDLRHDRPVAVKVLRSEITEAVGIERFLAEIKTTANLQHANILGLIDSGHTDGTIFYVMPFVDGESLRQRLARERQLPVADAVHIAVVVARALDYAHRRGVIHRDIKPENILLHEGQPVVADFGIALAVTNAAPDTRMTQAGVSLGTPQYMSPEQAIGERALDGRTDIYALGCVLYETLTGAPPFTGPNAQAIIAKAMTVEPEPVTLSRRTTPANVAAAIATALHKLPADRFGTAAEFASALENSSYRAPLSVERLSSQRVGWRGAPAIVAITVTLLATLGLLAAVEWRRTASRETSFAARFEIQVPDSAFRSQVVLGNDGRRVVWAAASGYYERRVDSLGIRRLRDATPGFSAMRALSPDGRQALVSGRGGIIVVPLAGGESRLLSSAGRMGAWGGDGLVYIAYVDPASAARGLLRIRPEGGQVDTLTRLDAMVTSMAVLPNGSALILATARGGASELEAFDLRSRKLASIGVAGAFPRYVEPGLLFFARGSAIWAGPFSEGRLRFTSPPVELLDAGTATVTHLEASRDALVYVPAPEQTGSGVVVRSVSGQSTELPGIPDTLRFSSFSMSPNGERLVMQGAPPPSFAAGPPRFNLFVYEIRSGRLTRLRSGDRDQNPAWLPDGQTLSFVRVTADTPTTSTLMRRRWDGGTIPESLLRRGGGRGSVLGPMAWLSDGRQLILRVADRAPSGRGELHGDLMRWSEASPARLDTVVATEYNESDPAPSPDGRLLAFTSDETGRIEVFVRRTSGGPIAQVSVNGGTLPRFSRTGRELYFASADTLFVASILDGRELTPGPVKPVLVWRSIGLGYAIMPGDTSFVVAASPRASAIVVSTNPAAMLAKVIRR